MDPTKTTYAELQAAWRHFNKALFGNQLPPCLVTLQRRANARGYFSSERFEHRVDRSTTDEIALNPKHFVDRSPADTLSTLVHEMVHLKQQHFGKPARGRYHNKQWADWMADSGSSPPSTGEPGGKRTGDRVSHYIVEGGPFDLACQAFLAKHQGLLWGDRPSRAKAPAASAQNTSAAIPNASSPPGPNLASPSGVASTTSPKSCSSRFLLQCNAHSTVHYFAARQRTLTNQPRDE